MPTAAVSKIHVLDLQYNTIKFRLKKMLMAPQSLHSQWLKREGEQTSLVLNVHRYFEDDLIDCKIAAQPFHMTLWTNMAVTFC